MPTSPDHPPDERHPMAVAYDWVGRILGVVAMMILPGIAGERLAKRWDLPILTLVGFVFGLTIGATALVLMTRAKPNTAASQPEDDGPTKPS